MEIKSPPFTSDPFPLKPGVVIDGKPAADCVVRLLVRSEQAAISKEPESQRDSVALARSIVRLGDCTDQNAIRLAVDALTMTDEARIRAKIAELEARALTDREPGEVQINRAEYAYDVLSQPFALNPGIIWKGNRIEIAVVRLIRRGEYKIIERETETEARDTLTLLYGIHQLGQHYPTEEMLDLLSLPDIQRIFDQMEKLRAQHAPESKSEPGEAESA
ncbi:MAG: hypothetical protein AB1631_30970 [Acidobacteriota bacterium]